MIFKSYNDAKGHIKRITSVKASFALKESLRKTALVASSAVILGISPVVGNNFARYKAISLDTANEISDTNSIILQGTLPTCPNWVQDGANYTMERVSSIDKNLKSWKISTTNNQSILEDQEGKTVNITYQIFQNTYNQTGFFLQGSGTMVKDWWVGQMEIKYNDLTKSGANGNVHNCSITMGTLKVPRGNSPLSGATIPVEFDFTRGLYDISSKNKVVPHAYDQTIEGTIKITCLQMNNQILPSKLLVMLFQDSSLYKPSDCQQIPVGDVVPGIPIGFISYNNTLSTSVGVSSVFTITPTFNFNNLHNSSLDIGAGYKTTGITLSLPGVFFSSINGGIAGVDLTLSKATSSFNITGPAGSAQLVTATKNGTQSSGLKCALFSLTFFSNGTTKGNGYTCSKEVSSGIATGTLDTSIITMQGPYGAAKNPIQKEDWLTGIGINWYGKGYYTMPNGKSIYFNVGQDLVTYAMDSGYTAIVSAKVSKGTSKTNPIKPNSDGTITWVGPGYYDISDKKANGGNPVGVYYVSNQQYILNYNRAIN